MKRLICVLLVIIMALSLNINALASNVDFDNQLENNANSIYVLIDGSGRYYKTDNKEGQKAKVAKDSGIYELENGDLLSVTGTNYLQPVDKFQVSLCDTSEVESILTNINLSESIKGSIKTESDIAIKRGNSKAKAVIYIPKTAMTRILATYYYTYNGYNMKDELLYYFDIDTGYEYIKTGITTNGTAQLVYDLTLIISGASNKYIGLFSSAISAYNAYINFTGQTPISGHTNDYLQVLTIYDRYTKYTYVDIGGYQLGAVTQQINVVSTDTRQYYFNYYGGNSITTHKNINSYNQTTNYSNPAPKALQYFNNPWTETITGKIYNHPLYF